MLSLDYIYDSELLRVIDGDTVVLRVDLGFRVHFQVTARLYGINAPEMRGDTIEAGRAAKAHIEHLCRTLALNADPTHPELRIKSHKARQLDKYGRWLVELIGFDQSHVIDVNINDRMVADGHAIEYML